jgi:glycine dehydrogenase
MTGEDASLDKLEHGDEFVDRHIGPRPADIEEMLALLGLESLDELVGRTVPEAVRRELPEDFPGALSERDALSALAGMAAHNKPARSMIGLGYHDTITPPVIQRNLLESPGWYTAYTPYQPEISQGRLEALLNFQTMVMELSAMEIANASLLDEASAAAEAMAMSRAVAKGEGARYFVAASCHPQTIAVVRTRARPLGIEIEVGDPDHDFNPEACFGILLQYPGSNGALPDYGELTERAHAAGALVTVASDLLSLVLLRPPGEFGADIVVGSAQRFGVPMGFGGPHAAFFATREAYRRALPGRIVGVSLDAAGRPALRLALQTREQHIRREKATSNICTAQVLLAVIAGMYAVWHGPEGLRTIALRVHRLTSILAAGLKEQGHTLVNESWFDTLSVEAGDRAGRIIAHARKFDINLRAAEDGRIGIALDETTTALEIEQLWQAFAGLGPVATEIGEIDARMRNDPLAAIPAGQQRTSRFLDHPCFTSHHSETEMLRYLGNLEDKDIALDHSMIPLGSCTMKLNATAEMIPITWPGFARMHPFAPLDQAAGYRELIESLEQRLCRLSGFAAVSLQPNAGSQGEFAGLLIIRRWHESQGQGNRRVCLIPSSAHGTNPASAVMAGMSVVVVECDAQGNIDIGDLRAKVDSHKDDLAALMVTYPSTHGVFEEGIVELCEIVHGAGGQVYMDGANMNALVGLALPGRFGPDVAHMNLHKTFAIPHGGGGPGVGPIGVGEHLAPFLPGHPLRPEAGPEDGIGPVAAAPWGSAGVLPISWAYIAMMGRQGLTRASEVAILNANYIAHRLSAQFTVLYTGAKGFVAHECIIDLRPFEKSVGVTTDDICKRLMDYGFHAPTMHWPEMGTIMIEPTESESRAELDRFCDALIAIREEIRRIEEGKSDAEDNPLKNAPHTVEEVSASQWSHAYSREEAAWPLEWLRGAKYWPPVKRIDNVYGDRHLVCSCAPLDDYRVAAD